jgi:hypothetical protein
VPAFVCGALGTDLEHGAAQIATVSQSETREKELPMMTTNRLETIAKRQRNGRNRDLLFACFVALAAIIGATTVGAAVHAASTADVAQR